MEKEQLMQEYLVDVPVQVYIWNRPELQRKQFDIIKKVKPSVLFVVSDGANDKQSEAAIALSRKMYETEIDWNCKVYKLYETANHGLYEMQKKAFDLVFKNVDRCIILEDDVIPSVSFFRFCKELLDRYKNDLRVSVITGGNILGEYTSVDADYLFCDRGNIWGYALWKRTYDKWQEYTEELTNYDNELLTNSTKMDKKFLKMITRFTNKMKCDDHIAGAEYYLRFGLISQSQLAIVPKFNMISQQGCVGESTNSDDIRYLPKGIRRVFNMPVNEINFPLKHPKFIIADENYRKKVNRILAFDHPVIEKFRYFERAILLIKSGRFKILVKKIKQYR